MAWRGKDERREGPCGEKKTLLSKGASQHVYINMGRMTKKTGRSTIHAECWRIETRVVWTVFLEMTEEGKMGDSGSFCMLLGDSGGNEGQSHSAQFRSHREPPCCYAQFSPGVSGALKPRIWQRPMSVDDVLFIHMIVTCSSRWTAPWRAWNQHIATTPFNFLYKSLAIPVLSWIYRFIYIQSFNTNISLLKQRLLGKASSRDCFSPCSSVRQPRPGSSIVCCRAFGGASGKGVWGGQIE